MWNISFTARALLRNAPFLPRTPRILKVGLDTIASTTKMQMSTPPNDDSDESDKPNRVEALDIGVEDDEDEGIGPQKSITKCGSSVNIRSWTHEYDDDDGILFGGSTLDYVDPKAKNFIVEPPESPALEIVKKAYKGMSIPSRGADMAHTLVKKRGKKAVAEKAVGKENKFGSLKENEEK